MRKPPSSAGSWAKEVSSPRAVHARRGLLRAARAAPAAAAPRSRRRRVCRSRSSFTSRWKRDRRAGTRRGLRRRAAARPGARGSRPASRRPGTAEQLLGVALGLVWRSSSARPAIRARELLGRFFGQPPLVVRRQHLAGDRGVVCTTSRPTSRRSSASMRAWSWAAASRALV